MGRLKGCKWFLSVGSFFLFLVHVEREGYDRCVYVQRYFLNYTYIYIHIY